MHRRPSQKPFLFLLISCIIVLTVSLVLLLPQRFLFSPTVQQSPYPLPENITLTTSKEAFSTSSASLTTDTITLDQNRVLAWVQAVALTIATPSASPMVSVSKNGKQIVVSPGKIGIEVNKEQTVERILHLDFSSTASAKLVETNIGKELTPDAILETQHFGEKLLGKKILIQAPHFSRTLTPGDILSLIDPPTGFSSDGIDKLAKSIDDQVSTPPIEPELIINDNGVEKFVAPKDGRRLQIQEFTTILPQKVRDLANSRTIEPISLTFESSKPKNSLAQTNSLGIAQRLGIGESEYAHSIPNRIKNVSLTTSKIHAKLVRPGEEFSFNTYLGEVSAKTGFFPAYVIKEGQTVLGDGGGVCQVSSTLFRAVLNAGLPVTERRGHSYRVSYYEENSKPGFDATVYSPHPDFRFKNDTDTAILVNAVADPKTLSMYIELWGKPDGRKAEIINYKQWDASAAPPPVYQDDPTLPPGKLKQIDFAAPGLKTSFDYVVTYPDGSVKTKNFATNYIPWRAVYLRGV